MISNGRSHGRVPWERHRIAPQVHDEHLVLYLLYDIISFPRWFPSYYTTKNTRNWWDIEATCLHNEWTTGMDGYHELGIPSWPRYLTPALCKFGKLVCPSKVRIHWVLATYWLIWTWTTYICPFNHPCRFLSVIIQWNSRPQRWGRPKRCLAWSWDKNSTVCDVITGIPEWANQRAFSCHVTATSAVLRYFRGCSACSRYSL